MASVTSSTFGPRMASSQPLSMTGRGAIAGLVRRARREQLGAIAELALEVVQAGLAGGWLTLLSESGSSHERVAHERRGGDVVADHPHGAEFSKLR